MAGAENIRVFDWRENDKTYKSILANLKNNLKETLEHAEYLQAKYDALKAQEVVLFRAAQASAGPRGGSRAHLNQKALPAAKNPESAPWK